VLLRHNKKLLSEDALIDKVCHKQLSFGTLFGKQIVADFAGSRVTSDAGGLLFRAIDERYGLSEAVAESLLEPRHPSWVILELKSMVKQRLCSIALGYGDTNDAATLRGDPALEVISGSLPETSVDLASAPTLCQSRTAPPDENSGGWLSGSWRCMWRRILGCGM
jgi:hypothetical protein